MITLRGLTKRYGEVLAVDDLTVDVEAGKVTGFLGPNGAGKSTTMRMLLGLDHPTSGQALVEGRRVRDLAEPLRSVGALLDAGAVHPGRTGRDHLRVAAHSNGIALRRVDEVLGVVGLESVAGRRLKGWSLGMRQRLGIAAALLGDPPVLLFDEPVNGLDLDGVRWVRRLVRELADEGRTVLVSSHLMSEMQQTADQLVVLGRLLADASIEQVLRGEGRQQVRERTPAPAPLGAALSAAGLVVRPLDGGDLLVEGAGVERVGDLARARRRRARARRGQRQPGAGLPGAHRHERRARRQGPRGRSGGMTMTEVGAVPSAARIAGRAALAKWTRLRTVRTTWWCLLATAVTVVGMATLLGLDVAGDQAAGVERTRPWPPATAAGELAMLPGQFGLLVLVLLAVTAEYGTGAIGTSLQWTARRRTLLLTRTAVATVVAVVAGVLLVVTADVVAWAVAPVLELTPGELAVSLLGVAGVLAGGALLAAGLGFLLRSTAGALASVFLLMLVLLVLPAFGIGWLETVGTHLRGRRGRPPAQRGPRGADPHVGGRRPRSLGRRCHGRRRGVVPAPRRGLSRAAPGTPCVAARPEGPGVPRRGEQRLQG